MINTITPSESTSAQKGVSGGAPVRPDKEHPRDRGKDFSTGGREHGQSDDSGHGDTEHAPHHPRRPRNETPHPSELEAKPPPDDPGLVMVRQLAGDERSDEALGRLLDDLDGLNQPLHEPQDRQAGVEPIAPFVTSSRFDGPYSRAASAYEWGHQALNRADPIRPGSVYSEKF